MDNVTNIIAPGAKINGLAIQAGTVSGLVFGANGAVSVGAVTPADRVSEGTSDEEAGVEPS